jgi:hypothetical protein
MKISTDINGKSKGNCNNILATTHAYTASIYKWVLLLVLSLNLILFPNRLQKKKIV